MEAAQSFVRLGTAAFFAGCNGHGRLICGAEAQVGAPDGGA